MNDIADYVSSNIKLYADDTKIYRELRNPTSDIQTLQSDLDSLGHWANTWQLRFNGEKCEAMRITHSREKSSTDYTLGSTLKDVNSFKDLGVVISKDLSWSQHISIIVNKANQVLGLVRRTVGTANTSTFSLLYKSLVRPLLQYDVPVWNPYLVKDIHAIENVQRAMYFSKRQLIDLVHTLKRCLEEIASTKEKMARMFSHFEGKLKVLDT